MEVSYSKTQQKPKCRTAVHILNDKIHFKYQENVICKFFVARNCMKYYIHDIIWRLKFAEMYFLTKHYSRIDILFAYNYCETLK